MARSPLIPVIGKVVECVQRNLFKVALPNGHELLGHVPAKMASEFNRILPGKEVSLQLTPHDLTKGQIIGVLD